MFPSYLGNYKSYIRRDFLTVFALTSRYWISYCKIHCHVTGGDRKEGQDRKHPSVERRLQTVSQVGLSDLKFIMFII
jgi:hypothetical protein